MVVCDAFHTAVSYFRSRAEGVHGTVCTESTAVRADTLGISCNNDHSIRFFNQYKITRCKWSFRNEASTSSRDLFYRIRGHCFSSDIQDKKRTSTSNVKNAQEIRRHATPGNGLSHFRYYYFEIGDFMHSTIMKIVECYSERFDWRVSIELIPGGKTKPLRGHDFNLILCIWTYCTFLTVCNNVKIYNNLTIANNLPVLNWWFLLLLYLCIISHLEHNMDKVKLIKYRSFEL